MQTINELLNNTNELLKLILILLPTITLIYKQIKKMIFAEDERNEQRKKIKSIYSNLNQITTAGPIRAVILLAKPTPKINFFQQSYGYVLHEISNNMDTASRNWNKQILDSFYIKLLLRLQKTGEEKIYAEQTESKDLERIYKSQNIVFSDVFLIYTDSNKMIYLSINYDNFNPVNAKNQLKIHNAINNIKNLYQANPDL